MPVTDVPSEYAGEEKPQGIRVAGTTWEFCGATNKTVTFELDGHLTYRTDGKTTAEVTKGFNKCDPPGLWRQDEDHVVFDVCRFTEFDVHIVPGTQSNVWMKGEWRRLVGTDHFSTCLRPVKK